MILNVVSKENCNRLKAEEPAQQQIYLHQNELLETNMSGKMFLFNVQNMHGETLRRASGEGSQPYHKKPYKNNNRSMFTRF